MLRTIDLAAAQAEDVATKLIMARLERYRHSRELTDLYKYRDTTTILPGNDPGLASHLNNVGTLLFERYEITPDMALLDEAIDNFQRAVAVSGEHTPSPTSLKSLWVRWFGSVNDESISERSCRYHANL